MILPSSSIISGVMRPGRYCRQSTGSKKLTFTTGAICGAAPSRMSTCAFCPAENSVATWLTTRAMSGPGRKLMRMLVPKALLIAAWNRAAPWLPPSEDWLQLSVTAPSRLAAAASSLRAAFMSSARAVAQPAMVNMPARQSRRAWFTAISDGRAQSLYCADWRG